MVVNKSLEMHCSEGTRHRTGFSQTTAEEALHWMNGAFYAVTVTTIVMKLVLLFLALAVTNDSDLYGP